MPPGTPAFGRLAATGARRTDATINELAWDGDWYRRAYFDDGTPLGYLEGALMRQFGGIDSVAVSTVIKSGRAPVTLEELEDGLEAARPELLSHGTGRNWFDRLWQEIGSIAVIRKEGEQELTPAQRFDRARRALDRDRVELAILEVEAMPRRVQAKDWLQKAHRYMQARRALDRLEAVTLAAAPVPAA